VNKIHVAVLQRPFCEPFAPFHRGHFAYNEVPAFAVAKRLLVQGASLYDVPFFLVAHVLIQSLEAHR
jgi:hypothetical protein